MKNESKVDRLIRVILGLVFLYLAFFITTDGLSLVLYVLAILMILSAITGFCALYKIFKFSTKKA